MKKQNTFKKLFVTIIIAMMAVFCLQLPLLSNIVNAATESVIFSNGDFTGTSDSQKPAMPQGFKNIGNKNGNIKSGVVLLNETDFEKNKSEYGLTGSANDYRDLGAACPDDKPLLINNISETDASFGTGFESDEFTLSANNYYKLSVYARSINKGFGTITLKDSETKSPRLLTSKNITSGGWTSYTFYIETHNILDTKAKLQLWLGTDATHGSLGAVMFDTIKMEKIDATTFTSQIDKVSLKDEQNKKDLIKNPSFENIDSSSKLANWKILENGKYDKADRHNLQTSISSSIGKPGDYNNSTKNIFGLLLHSENDGYAISESETFIIKQNERIRISFWAKISNGTTATAKVLTTEFQKNGVKVSNGETTFSESTTISNNTSLLTNGYTEYSFILNGNINYDSVIKIQLALGSSEAKTKGFVVFDNFNTEALTPALNTAAKSLSNIKEVNLNTATVSSGTVANGFFNFADEIEYNDDFSSINYPLKKVSSFTKTSDNEINSISGIIDINTAHFEKYKSVYGTSINPKSPDNSDISDKTTNNILMIHNESLGYTTFSSESKSLTKNTYYKITADTFRTPGATGKATIKITSDNLTLATIEINNGTWTNKEIYIFTGMVDSTSIKIELCLGNKKNLANGHVYFDNLRFVTSTVEEFNSAKATTSLNVMAVDFGTETFDDIGGLVNGETSLYDTTAFTLTGDENALMGVYKDSPVGNSSNENKNVFVLNNRTHGYSSAIGTKTFAVETDKYYKVKVYAKLTNIDSTFIETDKLKYGATIALDGYKLDENRFVNLKDTKNSIDESVYNEFTFMLKTTEITTIKIFVAIGSEEIDVGGQIYIDKIAIEETTKTAFEEYNPLTLPIGEQGIKIGKSEPVIETPDEVDKTPIKFNWFYFSTIIIVLTLIVVIVTLLVKKIQWNKILAKDEVTMEEYDKRKIEHEQEILAKKELKARKRAGKISEEINNKNLIENKNDLTKKTESVKKDKTKNKKD